MVQPPTWKSSHDLFGQGFVLGGRSWMFEKIFFDWMQNTTHHEFLACWRFLHHQWPGQPLIFQIFSKSVASIDKPSFGGLSYWHIFSKTHLKNVDSGIINLGGCFKMMDSPKKSDCLILESCMLLLKNCWETENPVFFTDNNRPWIATGGRLAGRGTTCERPQRDEFLFRCGKWAVNSLTLVGLVIAGHKKLPRYMWIFMFYNKPILGFLSTNQDSIEWNVRALNTPRNLQRSFNPTERTPKPEYFIALATCFGVPLVRSHWIFDGNNAHVSFDAYQTR